MSNESVDAGNKEAALRWERVNALFHAVLARQPDERAAFLAAECAGDGGLRAEVESLLSAHVTGVSTVAQQVSVGTRIGDHEITGFVASGGMGDVYRARDTKLGRDVALKILPSAYVADPDRRARFEREAKTLAALNHPNIAIIYDFEKTDDIRALVMELVEGPTLADRIAKGPIPLDEALPIARQLADALEAAHEEGIVHRDLKPANIKVRSDGTVKVLDFGLAKALQDDIASADLSHSPTSVMVTRKGVILGTAAYMAPEQARGRTVDKRADIWAFGCVLYEMLSGRPVFEGSDGSEILAAVIKSEVNWSALDRRVPSHIRTLLRRCIEKDPRRRLRDIGDARLDLEDDAVALADPLPPGPHVRVKRREQVAWFSAAAALAALAGATYVTYFGSDTAETAAYLASIEAPADSTFVYPGSPAGFMVLSRDGRRLAFIARGSVTSTTGAVTRASMIWVRELDQPAARLLAGTNVGPSYPCWSPDGRYLAFLSDDGQLKKIDLSGGPPTTLSAQSSQGGCSWNGEDVIIFRPQAEGPLYRVPASGGMAIAVTTIDSNSGETTHAFPSFLPDGRRFLYAAMGGGSVATYVGSLDGTDRTAIVDDGANAQFSRDHLLFLRGSVLLAQPIDPRTSRLSGSPTAIAQDISIGGALQGGAFSVSENGVLTYRTGSGELMSELTWFDRLGRKLGTVGERGDYIDLELSPDRTRAAVAMMDIAQRTRDVWLFDVRRGLRTTRLTLDPSDEMAPTWSPDGSRIAFLSATGRGVNDVRVKPASGLGATEVLGPGNPRSWSPDNRYLIATVGSDLWVLPIGSDQKPVAFTDTPFAENFGKFSPDGRWVAYHSNESGRNEVYVAPFPGPGGKERLSTNGGTYARWRPDGREVFYLDEQDRLMAVAVDSQRAAFMVGNVRPLFQLRPRVAGYPYDVADEGQRFLVNTLVDDGDMVDSARAGPNAAGRLPITLFVNWPALLKQ